MSEEVEKMAGEEEETAMADLVQCMAYLTAAVRKMEIRLQRLERVDSGRPQSGEGRQAEWRCNGAGPTVATRTTINKSGWCVEDKVTLLEGGRERRGTLTKVTKCYGGVKITGEATPKQRGNHKFKLVTVAPGTAVV
jgi:hypothetical protein